MTTMLFLAFATQAALQGAAVPTLVDQRLKDAGFVLRFRPPPLGSYSYQHKDRPFTLSFNLHVGDIPNPGNLSGFDENSQNPPKSPEELRPRSGYRLGPGLAGHRASWGGPTHEMFDVKGYRASINVRSGYQIERASVGVDIIGREEGDGEFVEGIVRWTYALLEAQACQRTQAMLNGLAYGALRDSRGRSHVSAALFASRTGRAVSVNKQAGRALMSSPRGDVLLVLGCPEVKVGSTWYRLDGVVLADGEDILIPTEILPQVQ